MTGVSVLCAALVLLGAGWLLKTTQGRWLAPGPFFALYWAAGLALPPILAPGFVLTQAAVWYIVALAFAFMLGSVVGSPRRPERATGLRPRPLNLPLLRWFVVAGTAAGVLGTVVLQSANGYSITSVLSGQALLDASAAFSIDRYGGDVRTPAIVPALLGVTYAASLVAPFAARGLRLRSAVACYAGPFLAATMYAVLTTARLGMLAVAFFLFAGWIVSAIWVHGETPRLRPRALIAGALSFAALAGAFISIAFLRVGTFDPAAQRVIGAKLVGYAVGYLSAFSQWLADSATTGPDSWGAATFRGVVNVGGGSEAFTDRRPLGDGSGMTNIFTAWRFLVEDFGVAGAPLAAFVLGWLVTWAWRRTVEQPTTIPAVVLICGYAYLLNSTTQTAFLFTNIVAAVVLAALVLRVRPPRPQEGQESPHEAAVRRARKAAGQAPMAGNRRVPT